MDNDPHVITRDQMEGVFSALGLAGSLSDVKSMLLRADGLEVERVRRRPADISLAYGGYAPTEVTQIPIRWGASRPE